MSGKRILVVGSGGAGKSTLARSLGERVGLPVVHLDRHYWRPGWVEPPRDEWRRVVAGLVAEPEWVMDGNYGGTLDLRVPAADIVVFLDLSRRVTIPRVVRRATRRRSQPRPDMAPGCPERIDRSFLTWVWTYPRSGRARLTAALEDSDAWDRVVRLRTPRQVRAWLAAQPRR